MKKHIGTRGMIGMPAILVILGIILVGGIGYSVSKDPMGGEMENKDAMMETPTDGTMMKNDEMMHKDGEWTPEEMEAMEKDAMMKKEDPSMMKKDLPAQAGDAMMEKPAEGAMMKKDDSAMMEGALYKGTVLAGKSAPLLEFNQADYDMAMKSGKLIVLFFHANWCPMCKEEFPKLQAAFNAYTGSDVVGFRVNYKDDETEAGEKALAAEFGISSQRTKVFVKNGTKLLKAPDAWDSARYTSEITKYK